jgi:hypothetical protein
MAPRPPRSRVASWKRAVPLLALLTVNACIVYISTSPTPVAGATIVFVAIDDHGRFVRGLRVVLIDVAGAWRADGLTETDGSFQCGVRAGITRVRTEVVPPAGYVLTPAESWPRHLDVSSGANLRIEIRVRARRL